MRTRHWVIAAIWAILPGTGPVALRADDTPTADSTPQELAVEHAECTYVGRTRDTLAQQAMQRAARSAASYPLTAITEQVQARLAAGATGGRAFAHDAKADSIDAYIFADFQSQGIQPAERTTDWEFIRRVTLDLTGRLPKPDRVLSFVADKAPDKRAKLIDELLARPEWVDKWTMFFGDFYKNTDTRPSSGIRRFPEGRNAFYAWIRDSLASGKPSNQMPTELITATGDNSYKDGTLNYLIGNIATGGPQQDVTDAQTAAIMDNFLGLSHVNCLLCHNGRGHLDTLSLWGKGVTRYQAWQLASYLSHTQDARTPVDPSNNNVYYWSQLDNTRGFTVDYQLNTTIGNRPARQPSTTGCKAGQPCYYVAPQYIFTGESPKAGENYRAALARQVTGDFQFARAAVNYIWNQFFGRGIVDPVNTFDPARLDPDNPPPDPWTLQPSNARLLNALAQHFIDNKYDLKALMREIANSDTYQLSSRYQGTWKAEWEPYFARKFVRRLWGEEIHDALVDTSLIFPSYNVAGFSTLGFPLLSYAMQAPDVVNMPTGTVAPFIDSFLRGNRDDNERKGEGSVQQALNLMNDAFVQARLATTGANANQLIVRNLGKSDSDLVDTYFLTILSRYPTDREKAAAVAALGSGNRTQAMQDLVWALYNKVDFVFNY